MTAGEWWIVGGVIYAIAVVGVIAFLRGAHVDDEDGDR